MKPFIHDDFLLETSAARQLYHEHAESLPIIDYHCHLLPQEVAEDKRWDNISQIWLGGDHYKWRAMRSNGVEEKYATGDASDREKFDAFAATMPYLLRNPIYHWSQLELARYFGVTDLLSPDTAEAIWNTCNAKLATPEFSARGLMKQSKVKLVCTTDDPVDSLEYHKAIAADASFDVQVLPTWRPDKAMAVDDTEAFNAYVDKLGEVVGEELNTFDKFMAALQKRQDYFHECGCRLSDHGLEEFYAEAYTPQQLHYIFEKIRCGKVLRPDQILKFKSAMLYEFGLMNHAKGWTQQYHYGVIRGNNTRMVSQIGPDTGFDSIGDFHVAKAMARLFDRLDSSDQLARTILYNINPSDNYLIATMLGNFQSSDTPGKIQMGSGWWFCDQMDGMLRQMEAVSQLGLLRRFVGMLTDSRSFLSYTRHEYFRRILCNLLGGEMERGLLPHDMNLVGAMVQDICYHNAARYFGFDLA